VSEYLPASLLLQFEDEHLLESLESCKVKTLLGLMVVILIALMDQYFLQGSDVFVLEFSFEYLGLELS
jgi:hypothetical protein